MEVLSFRKEGIFCEPGKFYIDPWLPVDYALITHGHSDHARTGMKRYLCHHHSVPILKSRLGAGIQIQSVAYEEKIKINGVHVSFHPAGHILGSAQIRIEYKGKVVVISGDYKLQDDRLSTAFEPVKCHEFVTESTFGLPIYTWSSIDVLNKQLQDWVLQNKRYGKTSVFIGYSLGKAQRILQAVAAVCPTYVHYSIHKMNQAYLDAGIPLSNYQLVDFREDIKHVDQQVLILPPSLLDTNIIKKIPNMAYAICSGWMAVRGARRWRSADAGFAMSDHADWNDLLQAVRLSEAEKVYVTHGKTAVFAKYLNEMAVEAEEVKTAFSNNDEGMDVMEGGEE